MLKQTKNAVCTADDVVNWLLMKPMMTRIKLQGLMYYSYVWALALYNDKYTDDCLRLFSAKFIAKPSGPYIEEVQRKYQDYKFDEPIVIEPHSVPCKLKKQARDVLAEVYDRYGEYNGPMILKMAKQEDPWKIARNGALPLDDVKTCLDDEIMFNYYFSHLI